MLLLLLLVNGNHNLPRPLRSFLGRGFFAPAVVVVICQLSLGESASVYVVAAAAAEIAGSLSLSLSLSRPVLAVFRSPYLVSRQPGYIATPLSFPFSL